MGGRGPGRGGRDGGEGSGVFSFALRDNDVDEERRMVIIVDAEGCRIIEGAA